VDNQAYNSIVSFIWGIADDCLRDVYVRGKYRDVILPMTVIRRLDAVLEATKDDVLPMKQKLDEAGLVNQTESQERLLDLAEQGGKSVSINLFGQESQPETYAIAQADMLLKGEGEFAMLPPQYGNDGKPLSDKKGKHVPDKDLTDTEQIPLDHPGGIDAFIEAEVLPYAPDAWVDESKTQIGYEISFTKHFYKPVQLRELSEIVADIRALEAETEGLLDEVLSV